MIVRNGNNYLLKLIIGVIVLILIGCRQVSNTENNMVNLLIEKSKDLKQNKNDLLNGTFKAICYSGFREGQHPDRGDGEVNPTYQEILEDLEILSNDANFSLIRLYDSGKNSQMVLEVIKENNIDIKVMLGIWLNAELSNHEDCPWLDKPIPEEILNKNKEGNLLEINTAIELANKYQEIIIAVNVGNEALVDWNDHLVSADTIITYVEKVKNSIEQPVTVADNFKWWSQSGLALSKVVDFISIHVYPLWEGQDIDTALAFSIDNIKEVANALHESKIVITEVGWATVASEFGDRASEEKQLRYYNEIMTWAEEMNITTFFFEAFDEPWKGDPNNMMGAEKHWGIYTVDRKPKLVMQ